MDDLNLIGSPEENNKVYESPRHTFQMKDLGIPRYWLGLHLRGGILFIPEVYKCYVINKYYILHTPEVYEVRCLIAIY